MVRFMELRNARNQVEIKIESENKSQSQEYLDVSDRAELERGIGGARALAGGSGAGVRLC